MRPEGRKSRPKAESGVGFLERGSKPNQLEGLREYCELPSGGSGRSPDRQKILKLFSALRMVLLTL